MTAALRHLLLTLLLALATAAQAQSVPAHAPPTFRNADEAQRFHALLAELRCVMCQNQSLADSDAQIAKDLRREVLHLMREGRSDEDIRDFLVARYGEFVLYRPRVSVSTWLLWFGPLLFVVGGAVVAIRLSRRGGRSGDAAAAVPEDDSQGVVMALFMAVSVALAIAVLGWALRPIWREKPLVGASIAALMLGGSTAVYALIGTPQALDADNLRAPRSMADAVAMLERKMADAPEREGFVLLAEAYARLERMEDARDAWERALAMSTPQAPAQPSELAAAAEARMRTDAERRFDAKAVGYLQRAIDGDPRHQRARFFLGLAKRQQGDAQGAAALWEPLLTQIDPSQAATLRKEVNAARHEAGLPALPAPSAAVASAAAADHAADRGGGLRVAVSLDPDFAARVRLRGDTTVFVIARAPDGPPMPVAVEKHPLSALPLRVVLDDGDSPMPTAKLSSLKEVVLVARLSASGEAIRQDGDIESAPVRVALPAKAPVALTIGAPP